MIDALLAQWMYVWPLFLVLAAPFCYWASEALTVAFVQVAGAGIFVLVGFSCFYHQGSKTSAWFFRLCLAWLVGLGLSVWTSADPASSSPVYWKIIGLVLVTVSMRYALGEEGVRNSLLFAAALAALVHGFAGVFEYFDPNPMPLSWVDPSQRGIIPSRSSGLFSDPNVYGAFLATLMPFVVAGWFSTTLSPTNVLLWSSAFLAGGAGILVSYSRGAYLAVLAGLGVVVMLRKPSWTINLRRKAFLAAGLILVIIFLVGPFKYRFFSMARPNDMTISQRTLLNKGLWDMVCKAPVFGFGLHTFSQIYPQFRKVGGDYPLYAHNEVLQTFIEGGVISAGGLVGMILILLYVLWRLFRRDAGQVSWTTASCGGAFASLLIHNLSGFSVRIFPVSLLAAIAVGGLLRALRREDLAPPLMVSRGPGRVLGGVLLALFVLFTFKNLHVQVLLLDASQAVGAKEYLVAESSLQAILKVDPTVPQAHYLLSRIQEGYGKFTVAEQHMDTALKLNPTEAIYWMERGRLEARTGGPRTEELFRKAVELDPASELFRLQYARFLASAARLLEAKDQLDEALRTSPGWHEVYQSYREVESFRKSVEERINVLKPPKPPDLMPRLPISREHQGVSGQAGIETNPSPSEKTIEGKR